MKNLDKKKKLIARTLGVGGKRIAIRSPEELKDAITRQDIRDLIANGVIQINAIKGVRKKEKRGRKRAGKIKMRIRGRKRKYIQNVRKLKGYLNNLKKSGKIQPEEYLNSIRKVKAGRFHNLNHLKEMLLK